MQLPFTRSSRLVRCCRSGVLVVALCAIASACDRHSATEAPESYGHGSAHRIDYKSHQIDSRQDSQHFSDTHGITLEEENESKSGSAATPKTSGKAVATPNPLGIGR